VAPLFRDWLQAHVPDRADRVMAALRQMRGGRDYESNFGTRMRGRGEYADLLAQRFALALRRNGYDPGRPEVLDCSRFLAPRRSSPQGELF
jgi:DNA repair photolyase